MDSDNYISIKLVERLLGEYGVSLKEDEKDFLIQVLSTKLMTEYDHDTIQNKIDRINLQLLLSSCDEGVLEISGTISTPTEKGVITFPKKIAIQKQLLQSMLEGTFAETSIKDLQKDLKTFQKAKESLVHLNQNRTIGDQLHFLLESLKEMHEFQEWNIRKLYCFLYDLCALNGIVEDNSLYTFKGDIAKEKEDWVKYRIVSYHTWSEKYALKNSEK